MSDKYDINGNGPKKRDLRSFLGLGVMVLMGLTAAYAEDGQKVTRANYELSERFQPEQVRKMTFDLNAYPFWIGQTDSFWYRWSTSNGTDYYVVDCAKGTMTRAFDNVVMASALSSHFKRPFDPNLLKIDHLEFSSDGRTIKLSMDGISLLFERASGLIREEGNAAPNGTSAVPAESDKYSFSPDRRWAVFARNDNVFMVDMKDPARKEFQLTDDGERWHTFQAWMERPAAPDQAEVMAAWWISPSKFVIERWDQRKVSDNWLIDPLAQPKPRIVSYKRSLAGDRDIDQYELWVFDCGKRSAVRIKTDKWKDQSLGGHSMDGGLYCPRDTGRLYFTRTNRPWTKIDLSEADLETGDVRTILEEEGYPHVTPTSRMAKIVNKGNDIIWWSDRDGWGHFYLYDGQGRLKNRMTSGAFCCRSILRVDEAARVLYFTASGKEAGMDPYYELLYRVNFDGTGLACLTPEDANHAAELMSFSPSGRYFVANHSRVDLVPRAVVRDARGKKVLELAAPDVSILKAAGWKAPEPFKVKAADNVTDLYGVMWKPFDFDPAKKYPTILFTYPGPIMEFVPKSFDTFDMDMVTGIAQLGFIVVHIGNRGGGSQRSKAYGTFGYGNIRDFALEDNRYAMEQAAHRFPFIDRDRIGVMGGSGGGFQSATLIMAYPDFFKTCVSWAGCHDMSIIESYWSELNHGVKEVQDKDGVHFESDVPTNFEMAGNLKGHLLLMNGLQDSRVNPTVMYRLVQALIEANRPFDMYILPDETHQFSHGRYLPYIRRIMRQYFAEHLMGDPRSKVEVFEQYPGPVIDKTRVRS